MLPTLVLENQFGEVSNNFVKGGSSQVFCNFIVDSANGNGLGIRSLKGSGVKAVYMHTSSTPAAGSPNPLAGYIAVQLAAGYGGYENGTFGFGSPVSGTPINVTSALTVGQAYVITTVGTTTQAQWETLGLQAGLVPAVGQAFSAITATPTVGTGAVEVPLATGSTMGHIEIVGDPNQSVQPTDGSGAWFLLQCLTATNSSTTTLKALAPVDGTVIGLTFNMLAPANAVLE